MGQFTARLFAQMTTGDNSESDFESKVVEICIRLLGLLSSLNIATRWAKKCTFSIRRIDATVQDIMKHADAIDGKSRRRYNAVLE